jgi:hypothetical protein
MNQGEFGESNGGEAGIFIIEYIHHEIDDYAFTAEEDIPMGNPGYETTREGRPGYRANYNTPETIFSASTTGR